MPLFRTFLLVLCLSFAVQLQAQVFMKPFASAAAMGLGTANISAPLADNGFANTASVADNAGSGLAVSSALPFGLTGWQAGSLQAWHGLNETTGAGLSFASSGIDVYREQQAALYFGKKLMRKFWVSTELYWLSTNASEYGNQNGYTFGLSALTAPTEKVRIAMRLYNPIQARLGSIESPTRLETGISYSFTKEATLYGAFQKDLDTPLQAKAGLFYQPDAKFSLRFGYQSQPARPSFGIGYEVLKDVRLDVAAEWDTVLGITPALGIVWNKKKIEK